MSEVKKQKRGNTERAYHKLRKQLLGMTDHGPYFDNLDSKGEIKCTMELMIPTEPQASLQGGMYELTLNILSAEGNSKQDAREKCFLEAVKLLEKIINGE